MAKQTINLGTAPTGVGGDTPRSAFTKAQSNFDELYSALGASGAGAITPAGARTSLGLGSAAIVDVVGLMSNNAIIEKGTSAAGDWIKWSDGTMICTFRYTGSLGINIAYGSVFYGDFPTLAFPQAFVSLPSIAMNVTLPGGGAWVGRQNNGSLTTTGSSIVVSPVTRGATTVTMEYIAVGRWKL